MYVMVGLIQLLQILNFFLTLENFTRIELLMGIGVCTAGTRESVGTLHVNLLP